MEDPVSAGKRPFQKRRIRDAALHKCDMVPVKKRCNIFRFPGKQVVDNDNILLLLRKFLNNMRADKPCATGDDVFHWAFPGIPDFPGMGMQMLFLSILPLMVLNHIDKRAAEH
jgi:hypothetical protein